MQKKFYTKFGTLIREYHADFFGDNTHDKRYCNVHFHMYTIMHTANNNNDDLIPNHQCNRHFRLKFEHFMKRLSSPKTGVAIPHRRQAHRPASGQAPLLILNDSFRMKI